MADEVHRSHGPVPKPNQLADQLERARHELLDLTARNRLLNTPLARGRSTRLDIVNELSSEVFRILVQERKDMSFLPARPAAARRPEEGAPAALPGPLPDEDDDSDVHLAQPDEVEQGSSDRHIDRSLQTPLDDEKLQTRLLRLFYDSKALFEEQGVNSLFLALGFLEWYEAQTSDKVRYAPLLLIPVELHRRTVNARFRVRVLEEEITTNLSLQAKLKVDFGLRLPDVPDFEDLVPADYFAAVENVITDQKRWKVHRDRMTLWFFSFGKFLMFRDLDPDVWPEGKGPAEHLLVRGLLGEPVAFEPPLIADNEPLDERLAPETACHVVDCDSSQAAAIEEVRGGRNLVIQGPPGTGKSQSISNIIAAAVRDGRTVLFVAEKLAALQVVKSRLDRIGLGDICLELHSHKANRRSVLDDLDRTLELGRPANRNVERQAADLGRARERLNRYVQQLHTPVEPCRRTPYELIGSLCRLQAEGIRPFDCVIPEIATWSTTTLREKRTLIENIVEHIAESGVPNENVWRGVRRTAPVLPSELQSLQNQLNTLHSCVEQILEQATRLAELLNISWNPETESFQSVQRLAQFAGKLRNLPEMDRAAIAEPVWERQRADVSKAIACGRQLTQCRSALDGVMTAAAWQIDVAPIRVDLAATGRSLFRWLSGRWRRAITTLRGLMEPPGTKVLDEQLQALDILITGRACLADLSEQGRLGPIGRAAFGSHWRGADSDWACLSAIDEWEADCAKSGVPSTFRRVIAQCTDAKGTEAAYASVKDVFRQTWDSLRSLIKELEIDVRSYFGGNNLIEVPLRRIHLELGKWRDSTSELGRWIVFQRRLREIDQAGLGMLLPEIERGELDYQSLDRLELMFCEAAMRQVLAEREEIASFDGISHNRLVEEFRRLDKERILLTRNEVAAVHFSGLPSGGDVGEVGIIRGEIRKKRRHRALRKLLAEAGHAVQAIKPVFMMSPISVAQFLEPGVLSFDLIVMDEASQVRPVEALGAILRCRQSVVVGDNRQLPPTAFFDRAVSGDEDDAELDGTEAADVESILDLCLARNFPQRMLRWHYRSRHHSLIAVSNREFYGDGLFVIPSPDREGSGKGLEFCHIADGIFDRGKTRTNRREAQAVAQAMIDHAREHPDMSLGVGAFSVAQRDAILDELELLRRAHPETEEFFARSDDDEPWFIKNLENIQGDERDVIFISVGYGRDESGFPSMNFGPLTAKGGERRLNVLISRAKQRCVVFSSMHAHDIDLRRTASRGAEALKSFLQYAETGELEVGRPTEQECDSEFEAQVSDALRSAGWELDFQVGIAGFFIDLAVIDPTFPGRYLLGIECDGATYHSARWARDRDRLRQAVLEDHGWQIHRIWSTDWFQSRDRELRKLLTLLEDLRLMSRNGDSAGEEEDVLIEEGEVVPHGASSVAEEPDTTNEIAREAFRGETDPLPLSIPYVEAQFSHPLMSSDLQRLSPSQLSEVIVRIVEVEGPVHADEVARRVTALWGLGRTGSRIASTVSKAVHYAVRNGRIVESAGFCSRIGQLDIPVRSREQVSSGNLRKPDMLPPQEIEAAILRFIEAHISASPEDTGRGVARLLGFGSTSQQLRLTIDSRVEFLLSSGRLRNDRGVLRQP